MTFAFVPENAAGWPVAWVCDALDVSESGCHAWVARSPSPTERRRGALVAATEVIHADIRGRYGSRRVTAELNARGHDGSEDTVAERMRKRGTRATTPRRFVRSTDSNHRPPVAENRADRDFAPGGPNAAWRGHHIHPDP